MYRVRYNQITSIIFKKFKIFKDNYKLHLLYLNLLLISCLNLINSLYTCS